MKKATAIWLIIATSLILVGCGTLGGVMMVQKWDFAKISTIKYETNVHEFNEQYSDISIITDTADILLAPSEDAKTSVICYEQKKVIHSVTVKDGKLKIEVNDARKWYEHIGIGFGAPKITLYIPAGVYGALSIKSSTGDVEIPKDFEFESINVSESTGDVVCAASAFGKIEMKASTGRIQAENLTAATLELSTSTGRITVTDATCTGDVEINVSTGRASLANLECQNLNSTGSTGDLLLDRVIAAEKISVERSTGDVKLNKSDAAEIFIKTDTGDVRGSLLSEKIFFPKTDTGRIDLPQSMTGGKCEIITDTGDIRFEIE